MYNQAFIHLSIDGHLGCFHTSVVVNNPAMNIGLHIFYLFIYLFIYILIFHYHLYPFYLSPPESPQCCPYPWILFTFCSISLPLVPSIAVNLLSIYESVSILLWVQFIHWIPHMSEIIWYLSFLDWLISLSIMFSRSIHAVTKVKFPSFLWPSSIPWCKCPIVVLSTHLLMDPRAASISWWL